MNFDITERKEIEEKLRLQQEQINRQMEEIEAVYRTAPVGLSFVNREHRFVRINERLAEINGLSIEEHIGKNLRDILPSPLVEEVEPLYRRVFETGEPVLNHEIAGETKAQPGARRDWILNYFPLRDSTGAVIGVNAVVQEITERKRIEEALSETAESLARERERLAIALRTGKLGAYEWHIAQNSIWWSPETYILFGVDPQSFTPTVESFDALVYPEDRERLWKKSDRSVAKRETFQHEYRIVRPDGEIRWITNSSNVSYDADGNAERVTGMVADITERKTAEEALLEQQRFTQNIIEAAPSLTYIYDIENHSNVFASTQLAPVLGYSVTEIEEMGSDLLSILLHPDDGLPAAARFERILADRSDETYELEYRMRNKNGKYIWLFDRARIFERDQDGKPTKILGVATDITSRKEAEEQLVASEIFNRTVLESSPDCIEILDGDARLQFINEKGLSLLEIENSADVQGKIWWDFWTAKSLAQIKNAFGKAQRGETAQIQVFSPTAKGTPKWWDVIIAPIGFDAGEEPQNKRFISVLRDITDQRAATEKLLEAERRAVRDYRKLLARLAPLAQTLGTSRELKLIYDALHEFVCAEMPCGAFIISNFDAETNRRAAVYAHLDEAEIDVSGIAPRELTNASDPASEAILTARTVIEKDSREIAAEGFLLEIDAESAWGSQIVAPVSVMDKVIGTVEIHHRKNGVYNDEHRIALEMAANLAAVAIENLRLINIEATARAAAEEANRAKDEFLAMLSHELRAPLNAMYGWTQILQTNPLNEETTRQAIEVIARNVRLQSTLIEDLLDVSRIISGKMKLETEKISLVSVVLTAVEAARPTAEKQGIKISTTFDTKSNEIVGDRHRMLQIINNLLANAVKFTPPGGKIEISLRSNRDRIELTVADSGVGINPEILPVIFDRFRQADGSSKRRFGGLGLGLAIVKHLVELHGGTVGAFSEGAGRGATFTVSLPLVSQPVSKADFDFSGGVSGNEQRESPLSELEILVVDDDEDALDLMCFVLEAKGAKTTRVNSAFAALEKFSQNHFDLIISDLGMAEMDGYDLIKKLREAERENHTPAIALTGYASTDDRDKALTAGFQKHLSKPVDVENLPEIVLNVIKENHRLN